MTNNDAVPVGRVCYYARQQCALERGCPTIGRIEIGMLPEFVELTALDCEHQRLQLYPSEIARGEVRTDALARNARPALHDKRVRKMRQLGRDRQQRAYNDAAAAAREEKQAAQEDA